MPQCVECGKLIAEGTLCVPCQLEEEQLDETEPEIFERFKKEKHKEK